MYQFHQNLLLLDGNSWVLSRASHIIFYNVCTDLKSIQYEP